jgi:hypothetical protein
MTARPRGEENNAMKIGFTQFVINPPFPVLRMLGAGGGEKIMATADDLHCRILYLQQGEDLPFCHVSIDTVELWKAREDAIAQSLEQALGRPLHVIASATHSHNCPCLTLDDDYAAFVLQRIAAEAGKMVIREYRQVGYLYQYRYFDQVGRSRVRDYETPHLYAETLSLFGDGKRVATFLIHNVHPTIRQLWTGPFTAEYPGYCITALRQEYPGEFFTFLLGPAGDVSPHFVRRSQDQTEMIRLAGLLKDEFDRQLKQQDPAAAVPVVLDYQETTMAKITRPFCLRDAHFPTPLNEDEQQALEHYLHPRRAPRQPRPMEQVTEYHLARLAFSPDYAIVFEPFELYSEYYGAVNKQKCSIATVSHGFEHYLTGLYFDRVSMHGSFSDFSDEMRRTMGSFLRRWSC